MTPERAKELLPMIQAFAEGKKLEYLSSYRPKWEDDPFPSFEAPGKWRVKPEPREWWLCPLCGHGTTADLDLRSCCTCNAACVHVREVLP